jgi:uncharacterized protein
VVINLSTIWWLIGPKLETGAGRFSFLRMRPMTLFESGHTTGTVSLAALLAGEAPRSDDPGLSVVDLADSITAGGWPAQHGRPVHDGARSARDYLEQITHVDVSRVAGTRRDPARIQRLLRSLARNVATEVSATVLAADAGGGDGPLDRHTVAEYLDILGRLMSSRTSPPGRPTCVRAPTSARPPSVTSSTHPSPWLPSAPNHNGS